MTANSFGPNKTTLFKDMAAFDRLPPDVRRVIREAPVQFGAELIERNWSEWQRRGGSLQTFCIAVTQSMKQAMREAGIIG